MSSRNTLSHQGQGDESDDLDLFTLGTRITKNSEGNPKQSLASDTPQDDEDEPDWVRAFSQSLPNEQQRRQALASQFDEDDDDSIIDLVPDDPDLLATQPSLKNHIQQSQKEDPEKASLKKQRTSSVPSNRMPLVVAPKLDESLVLLQSGDQGLDLSGDVGAVGRVKIERGLLYMDIKGTIYKADTTASNTACIVSIGDGEAKVTAILDEAVTLVNEHNRFASAEVVVHGEITEDVEDNESREDTHNEGETKSKKRKPSEKGKGRASLKPRVVIGKNSRKKS